MRGEVSVWQHVNIVCSVNLSMPSTKRCRSRSCYEKSLQSGVCEVLVEYILRGERERYTHFLHKCCWDAFGLRPHMQWKNLSRLTRNLTLQYILIGARQFWVLSCASPTVMSYAKRHGSWRRIFRPSNNEKRTATTRRNNPRTNQVRVHMQLPIKWWRDYHFEHSLS